MPVEIRELVIRAVVEPGGGQEARPGATKTGTGNEQDRVQPLEEAVNQVLEIINTKNER